MSEQIETIKALARSIADHTLDLQDELRDLRAKPFPNNDAIEIALIYVERMIDSALDSVHEAQQRLDSMPIQIPIREAAE